MRAPPRRNGLCLTELSIVAGIVAVSAALSVPAVLKARQDARRKACVNNLKQIGLSLHNYHDAFRSLPPGWVAKDTRPDTGPCYGWQVMLLPFLEEAPLFNTINFSNPPELTNAGLQKRIVSFRCPDDASQDTNPVRDEYGTSNWSGNYGDVALPGSAEAEKQAHGTFHWNSRVRFTDVKDGTSFTFAAGERCIASAAAIWMGVRSNQNAGDTVTACNHRTRINTVLDSFSSRHPGGAHFLFCDGQVRFVSEEVDSQEGTDPPKGVFQKLAHKSDGERDTDALLKELDKR